MQFAFSTVAQGRAYSLYKWPSLIFFLNCPLKYFLNDAQVTIYTFQGGKCISQRIYNVYPSNLGGQGSISFSLVPLDGSSECRKHGFL